MNALEVHRLRYACALTPWGSLTSALVVCAELSGLSGTGSAGYRGFLLGGVEFIAAAQAVVSWLFARRLAGSRSAAAIGAMRAVFIGLSLALGLVWATMPFTLFPPASPDQKVTVACTSAGLIATSLAFVPIAGAAEGMAIPISIASAYTLLSLERQTWLGLFACLIIYYLFISAVTIQVRHLLDRITLYRLETEEQRTTLQLLSARGDAGDTWSLWETDAAGAVAFLSPDMAQTLGYTPANSPADFLTLLERDPAADTRQPAPGFAQASDRTARSARDVAGLRHLRACMDGTIAFRDIVVSMRVDDRAVYWSLSGRPTFDDYQNFRGFRGLAYDVTEARAARVEEAHKARHDALTGMPNRYAFAETVRAALNELGRSGTPFALYVVDVDGFKTVNDRLGHVAGDSVLRGVAARLAQEHLSLEALSPGDDSPVVSARQGGDEFVLILRDADLPSASAMAQRIVQSFALPMTVGELRLPVHVSVGFALAPLAGDSAEALLEAADLAMYTAKRAGGNGWRCFEGFMRRQVEYTRELLARLRAAVRAHEVTLAYQPIIDARSLTLVGFEALARWEGADGSVTPPDRFIRLAEEAGLIVELGAQLLEAACRTAAAWPKALKIAVNISVTQIQAPDFPQTVQAVLARTGLAAERLELEVTESIFMDADSTCLGVLQALSDRGIRLVLDDFGRGYSSLGFLKGFDFSKIKLDTEFVRDILHDARSAAIVRAVVELAAELGVVITAEGVETRHQLAFLQRQGCTQVQGYLFGRAISAEKATLLARRLARHGFQIHEYWEGPGRETEGGLSRAPESLQATS